MRAHTKHFSRNLSKPAARGFSPDLLKVDDPKFFKYLLNHSGDEIMVIDDHGLIVYANEATIKGLGYPLHKLLNQPIIRFYKHPMSLERWKKDVFASIKSSSKPKHLIVERVVKGNKSQTIEVTAGFFLYNSGEYILSTARDVTEHTRLQKELKDSEELYRLLSEQAAEGIFIVSLDGHIQYLNKAGQEMLKLPASKIKGNHFMEFVPSEEREKAWESFQLVRKGDSVVRDEINIINFHKQRIPVEFTASPIYKNGKIKLVHAIARDITRKRQMEKLIAEAEKMKVFQSFISGTMHEIYHPLKAVMHHSDNLVNKYAKRQFEYISFREYTDIFETVKSLHNQIASCVETASRLIDINKRKAGLVKKFTNVNGIVKELFFKFGDVSKTFDVKIVLRLKDNLPLAAIAPLEMYQVVENILTNAIQASTSRGRIIVKSWYDEREDNVCVQVEDEGVGITKENLPHIFEPFFTTKSRGFEKNAGLGLSIVYSIVKAHKGAINIQSSQRKGTVVTVAIPLYRNGQKR